MVSIAKLILPLFIIGLLVFSVFGVVIGYQSSDNVERFKHQGNTFSFDGQTWFTFKNDQRIEFSLDPRTLDAVYIGDLINKIDSHNKIYLSVDPNQNLNLESQFFKTILGQLFQKAVINACPEDKEECKDLLIKNCQDSIPRQDLIIKLENGNNNLQEDESCIAIIGDRNYFITVLEKLRFEILL